MDYYTLPDDAFDQMRVDRLQQLEMTHFRVALRLDECDGPGHDEEREVALAEMADLERRIERHRDLLPDGPPEPSAPEPEPELLTAEPLHADAGPDEGD